MPTFSLVVIAYNRGDYIRQCLDSLVGQTFTDIEIIVVDDASTDGTLDVVRSYSDKDSRVRVIAKSRNEGAHLARLDGCAASTGDYVIFVDGDDALELTACELLEPFIRSHDVDIVRFGRTVVGETDVDRAEVPALEYLYNKKTEALHGKQIICAMYKDGRDSKLTYCVIDSVFKGDWIRATCNSIARVKLGRMQDAYESFVIASKAQSLITIPECRLLRYHYGRGVSGSETMTTSTFVKDQSSMFAVTCAVEKYAETQDDFIRDLAARFRRDVLRIVENQWRRRLLPEQQQEALKAVRQTWGEEAACGVLLIPFLARAKELVDGHFTPVDGDDYYRWDDMLRLIRPEHISDQELANQLKDLDRMRGAIDKQVKANLLAEEERQRSLERALTEERERRRLLKTGSAAKQIVDKLLPEESRMRRAIRGFLLPFRS